MLHLYYFFVVISISEIFRFFMKIKKIIGFFGFLIVHLLKLFLGYVYWYSRVSWGDMEVIRFDISPKFPLFWGRKGAKPGVKWVKTCPSLNNSQYKCYFGGKYRKTSFKFNYKKSLLFNYRSFIFPVIILKIYKT